MKRSLIPILLFLFTIFLSCQNQKKTIYDMVIRNGRILDGSGKTSYVGDIAINADTIAAIGSRNMCWAKRKLMLPDFQLHQVSSIC
ncbi:hypothetical protein NYZ99_05725 [Maribacter litopenaei]|uniref:Amidohydrolase family protein n=1 Tax=Maribacter litopenaei TaxID=2976127 RepID=A0ABY5YAZ8_9FLAO|nr:hypothetical protein [Maribacter litopenaei]UWX55884.1 hypothetical protein NYZ99_05725 [Maribacter litopenaei]